ncbi:MAG: protein kinase [Bdellovibrionales bacterium]|nr:protein kinase [Bdellovibrionales bacterium]
MADDHLISLQPGTVLGGRYEVVKCLGAGSMGLVYACRDHELDDHMVAVKVLFPEVAQDKTAAARFRNEIFASYGVSHPNVVRAYEYLRDGDIVAYTMEFVGGGDLAEKIGKDKEPLAIPEIVRLLQEMCLGVQAIHDAGIVHRDLKPENILLTEERRVKIADFGIARMGSGPKLTEHGGVVGTIDYVSPEYMLNAHVDWRSDIYAMGILAYEMIAQESPFRGESVYATMTKRLKTDPEPPSSLRPDCPRELDSIILRAMARDPEQRYQSTKAMYDDLKAYESGRPLSEAPTHKSKGYSPSPGSQSRTQSQSRVAVRDAPRVPMMESPSASFIAPAPQSPRSGAVGAFDNYDDRPQMQSVLSGRRDSWTPNQPRMHSREVRVGHGALDDQRIRRLSQSVHTVNRSLWIDILTWIVAVVIGIGVGFFFIKVFFPELLARPVDRVGSLIVDRHLPERPFCERMGKVLCSRIVRSVGV